MENNVKLTEQQMAQLEKKFDSRLKLAHEIFRESTFRYEDKQGKLKLSRPLYDAVMIAIDSLWDRRNELRARRADVIRRVRSLLHRANAFAVIVGRPNTANAIQQRIRLLKKTMNDSLR